jgi:predicted transporter
VLFHGALALVIVVLSAFSSQGLTRGLVIGLAYFAAATAWSWFRFHTRLKSQAKARSEEAEGGTGG